MRTRDSEETPRRKILSEAVRTLRERLKLPQSKFAQEIDVDAGTVSRWERAELAPTGSKRKALANLARKHRMQDLAAAFVDPVGNWRRYAYENLPSVMRDITAAEIVFINDHCLEDDEAAQRLLWE